MKSDYVVMTNGFLIVSLTPNEHKLLMEESLVKASRGEDPGVYDSSEFIKVSNERVGETLTVITDNLGEPIKVIDSSGDAVEFEVKAPLSYDRWNKPRKDFELPDSLGLERMTMHEDLHLRKRK